MAEAAAGIGIASFGVQVCQGLLSYYDGWKDYDSDLSSAKESVADLSKTLALLEAALGDEKLDKERKEQVEKCLQSCKDGLEKLAEKSQELQQYGEPEGIRQKTWSKIQRARYPFRAKTLAKARETVDSIRERLKLAVQVLQLDVSTSSKRTLSLLLTAQQSDQYGKISNWLSPPDPWTNHASARQRYEPQTGTWLLQSDKYRKWKTGSSNCLWLYGKAGCGKTILCSTVIEDIRAHCKTATNSGHAVFYFSFSDNRKQSYANLLRSLVVQLGWNEPALSMLVQAHEKPNRSLPGLDDLEKVLSTSLESFDEVFVLLDALDECPEAEEARESVLEGLERLSQGAPNLRVLATSREVSDVRDAMETLGADVIAITTHSVDADIHEWVSGELSRDRKLRQLDLATKALIEETISKKADGMFRWAYCQLQELKKLKSTKPKYVQHALRNLPATLDATYERILTSIEDIYRKEALTLLRWLAYARSPPTLAELAEAAIVDPEGDGVVDTANRGSFEDTLQILCGLVTDQRPGYDDYSYESDTDNDSGEENEEKREQRGAEDSESWDRDVQSPRPRRRVDKDTKIRLAHFSVKEYLESERILQSEAKDFYLKNAKEQEFLTQSCLTYLSYYSSSKEKASEEDDLIAFPLLRNAAWSWFYHSSLQESANIGRETSFLSSDTIKLDWLRIHQPDRRWLESFEDSNDVGSGIYYASLLGLDVVVNALLRAGFDVNAQGGHFGSALQAASYEGNGKVVEMLIKRGADVNAQGGYYSNALQAASLMSNEKVAEILIERGADVNAQGGHYGNTLEAASLGGNEKVVGMLIERGVDVNAQGGQLGNALQAASYEGNGKVVEMLIERGADVNAQGGFYSNALQAASYSGNEKVVGMLIERGADVNAQGGQFGNALQAASYKGNGKVVEMLIERGADVNAQGGFYSNALQAASNSGNGKVVEILIERGADVNTRGGKYGNALQAASCAGSGKVVEILIERGADVNAQGGEYSNALQAALTGGHKKVVEMLKERGAQLNAQGGEYDNAL